MELTWKVGEKRRGKIYGSRQSYKDGDRHALLHWDGAAITGETIEFTVESAVGDVASGGEYHDWMVSSRFGNFGVCEEWGATLIGDPALDKSVPFCVGQLRRMTVPHIHGGDVVVVVEVRAVLDGKVTEASCVECPSPWHRDFPTDKWTMIDAEDYGVVDRPEKPETTKQPKQEASMEIEERKKWASAQDWKKHIPVNIIQSKDGNDPKIGEVWACGYNEDYKAVVLVLADGMALVLAGKLSGYTVGETRAFTNGSLPRQATRLTDSESVTVPLVWKKGELRFGEILAAPANDARVLHANVTYTVVGTLSGKYEWEVEFATGPNKGLRFGATEAWSSTVVPESLMNLRLGTFEADPDAPTERPKFKKGEIYMVRKQYGSGDDALKPGMLLEVTRESIDIYAVGGRIDGKERCWCGGIWLEQHAFLQLMRPVGRGRVAVSKADQCGDKSTAYGLTCTERAKHGGEVHRNHEHDAEWEKRDVIKLGNCHNNHYSQVTDERVLATMMVDTKEGRVGLCEPCNVDREKHIAAITTARDAANPQPRRQERFMVESHTLEAGGVFSLRG